MCNVLALETQVPDSRPPQISALDDLNMIALEEQAMRGFLGRPFCEVKLSSESIPWLHNPNPNRVLHSLGGAQPNTHSNCSSGELDFPLLLRFLFPSFSVAWRPGLTTSPPNL